MRESTALRFTRSLFNTSHSWRNGLDRHLKTIGLGQAGWTTISQIANSKKPMSQKDLANAVGVESATMVGMLDRLERDGLVKRQVSATDRRVKLVFLTALGKKHHGKLHKEAFAYLSQVLDDIDTDSLEQAIALLDKIKNKIETIP